MPTNKAAIDWITRTLAFMGACCVITVCVLSYMGTQIPPELNTLTGGLVGSLASMLVKTTPTETPSKPGAAGAAGSDPVVRIDQPADDPIPVKPTTP